MTVHPRSRGEHTGEARDELCPGGSSPLARGTPGRRACPRRLHRFIPARAGNTRRSSRSTWRTAVHPRSRGEHLAGDRHRPSPSGSSPLARGTLGALPLGRPLQRFIPARAGNTGLRAEAVSPSPVHPRSRGEHFELVDDAAEANGSSPLARGTLDLQRDCERVVRFIPARAGNTRVPGGEKEKTTVHPRSRGEHWTNELAEDYETGSSPLARGTLGGPQRRVASCRFIPARAGNTWPFRPLGTAHAVHPRSRGEHDLVGSRSVSSGRFIPARAGNTQNGIGSSNGSPVHPRSRGEH